MAVDVIHIKYWQPDGLQGCLTTGGAHYIGIIDEATVLKYPHIKGQMDSVKKEAQIYEALGPHRHVVSFKGLQEDGIQLERIKYTLREYLTNAGVKERHRLCAEAVDTISFYHSKHYIDGDIKIDNMLVDEHGTLKFCDLEGQLSDRDGKIILPGLPGHEYAKSRWPSASPGEQTVITDIFALGTVMYYILYGHEPFPDLDECNDDEQIRDLFAKSKLPELPQNAIGRAIRTCWMGGYTDAREIVRDIGRSRWSGTGWCLIQ